YYLVYKYAFVYKNYLVYKYAFVNKYYLVYKYAFVYKNYLVYKYAFVNKYYLVYKYALVYKFSVSSSPLDTRSASVVVSLVGCGGDGFVFCILNSSFHISKLIRWNNFYVFNSSEYRV